MDHQKVVYIAGPITGVQNYWEAFEQAEGWVTSLGYIGLTPSRLPGGMSNAQYMRVCFAMIDSADVVLFLNGWDTSDGARLEMAYCEYTSKPVVQLRTGDAYERWPEKVSRAWLEHRLEEVMKT